MAYVTGPLQSVTASGQFGKSIIYETYKNRTYAKRYRTPLNDRTPSQIGIRAMVHYLTKLWKLLSTEDQDSWTPPALNQNVSPFNAYFIENMHRWRTTLGPMTALQTPPSAAYAPTITLVATGGDGKVDLSVAPTADVLTWTERQPAGNFDKNWWSAASDADGSHLLASISGGRLYSSADYGVNWTERQPAGNFDKNWRGVASDADGSHLLAAVSTGRLYSSADYGENWTERQPAGNFDKTWFTVASDSDGSHLLAGVYGGRLYSSANYGVNWTERRPAGNFDKNWCAVASDADGSHLLAGVDGGRLYSSADYGVNWTERQPAGIFDKSWQCTSSDADGSHLLAAIGNERLFSSADYGVNWTERQPAGNFNKSWRCTASDADGSHLLAGVSGGRLYSTADYGVNWTERQPAGDLNKSWRGAASDADGSHLLVAIYNGRLYSCVPTPAAAVAIFRDPYAITEPDRHICRAVLTLDENGEILWTDTGQIGGKAGPPGGLPAGTYHYMALPLSLDGRIGTPTSDAPATVT